MEGDGNGKVAVIDTERASLSKYVGELNPDGGTFEFDAIPAEFWRKDGYTIDRLVEAIKSAEAAGYSVVIIDSLSHFWFAEGGVLDVVDRAAARSKSSNTYFAWKEGTPLQNLLVSTITGCSMDVIATLRTKTEYAISDNNGKQVPKKIGTAPVQREGLDYEFDVVIDMDLDHNAVVTKTRCSALTNKIYRLAGASLAETLYQWAVSGTKVEFVLDDNRKEKLVAAGATEDQIKAIRSLDEAAHLFKSLRAAAKGDA